MGINPFCCDKTLNSFIQFQVICYTKNVWNVVKHLIFILKTLKCFKELLYFHFKNIIYWTF